MKTNLENTGPALPASTVPSGEVLIHKPRNVHGSHARLDQIILAREIRNSSSPERSWPDPYHLIDRVDVRKTCYTLGIEGLEGIEGHRHHS